ncbi:hypothetical protein TSAR_007823 [Trichomalopsis sarcophagae]|uniref:Uncharacterized protein n=1 Tax=Trichomalopsis sarcophagae TaxID=543379 RepID=A0A232FK51_9HYME|nr:hypothetical protein TSAR_007823 [Trichomalopsis sarcophagae]
MLQPEADEFASECLDSSVLDMDEEIESMRQHHRERWKRQQETKHSRIGVFFRRAWCKLKPGYSSNGDSGSSLKDDFFYRKSNLSYVVFFFTDRCCVSYC